MKKTIMIILLIFGLVVFGCLGAPNAGQNSTVAGGNTGTSGSGGSGSSGSTGGVVGGSVNAANAAQAFNRCNTDCTILGENAAVSCRVGCILNYAEAERSTDRCNDIYGVPRVDEYQLADTYYNGCLDVVGGAMGSIAPCSLVRGSSGSIARKNACISAVASESRQPALCDSMESDNTDPDPVVQQAYDQSFRQIVQDCRDSAR